MQIPPFYIKKYPDEFLKGIVKRETKVFKRGTLITIGGSSYRKTGTGKSWTALRIGELNDRDFKKGASKVVYFVNDFLKIMDEVEEKKRPGQVVVVDEAGSLISSDSWRSVVNRAISYTVQTFRYLRCAVVLVMPQVKLIDKRVRTMADYHISMSIQKYAPDDNKYKRTIYLATPYALFYDEWNDDMIRKSLLAYIPSKNRIYRLRNVPIRPVKSQKLIEEYEGLSMRYKKKLRELLAQDIRNYEKTLRKSLSQEDINNIIEGITKNEELLQNIVINRKIDKDLLAQAIQQTFDLEVHNQKIVSTIAKILKKRLGMR